MTAAPTTLRGILFDFDGVLAKTMEDNFMAWQKAFRQQGVEIKEEDYYPLEGMRLIEVAQVIGKKYNVSSENHQRIVDFKNKYYLEHHTFSFYPGVVDLIEKLHQKGVALAVVSASPREKLEKTVPRDFLQKFTAVVSGDDVTAGKPSPEPYLKGVEKLGFPKEQCLVVENAPLGIEAAKRAGLYCIAIASTVNKEGLRDADNVIGAFSGLPQCEPIKSLFLPPIVSFTPDTFIKKIKGGLTIIPPPFYSVFPYHLFSKKLKPVSSQFHEVIHSHLKRSDFPLIIQIGSADGISGDPLYGYIKKFSKHGKAVLVEPLPKNFCKLVKIHDHTKNVHFENAAIADKDGMKKFYQMRFEDKVLDNLALRRGTLRKEINQKRIGQGKMIEFEVKTMTLSTLLHKISNKINTIPSGDPNFKRMPLRIDLLHLDTEGCDFEIIKQIDFATVKPQIIFYEHRHLSQKENEECRQLLKDRGYFLLQERYDTLAYMPE